MSKAALQILAGSQALQRIQSEGFHPDLFTTLLGASGGPKWFVLSRLDRVLAGQFFQDRQTPITCLGSSIGSWRHACYAQARPVAALQRLEECYIHQHYSARPSAPEVSGVAEACVSHILGQDGGQDILDNPHWHSHILSVRSRGPLASDSRFSLPLSLAACALANLFSRQSVHGFFQRTLFHSGAQPSITFREQSAANVPLGLDNVAAAILSSGSIPLIMKGVRGIAGAPPGTYRDGGITDYHFDFEFQCPTGLVLYPHFYDHITPSWYDKPLPWRRIQGDALRNVVILSPSAEFVASLPYGKIPDRNDFRHLDERGRIAYWTRVCEQSETLAEAFAEAWHKELLHELVKPLPY